MQQRLGAPHHPLAARRLAPKLGWAGALHPRRPDGGRVYRARKPLTEVTAPQAAARDGGEPAAAAAAVQRVAEPPPADAHPQRASGEANGARAAAPRTPADAQPDAQHAAPAAPPSPAGGAATPHAQPVTPSGAAQPPARGGAQAGAAARQRQPPPGEPPPPAAGTQLIFRLERRGEGWGEEILPHLVVEQRPLAAKKKRAYSRPDPWKEGSLECYLVECGVPPGDVDRVVTQAVAWRVTPGGRSLIDRRRRSRVERNVRLVVEHLELECGVPFGPRGVAAILGQCPEIMLCKPTTNDRWDRRAVELSAFLLRNGHCNVPEDWEENPELGLWVKRQRIARAAGQLSEERLSILQSMGFAFGEVAQLTEEWEHRFDQLVDWMLWHNENQQRFSWLGVDWGARGGITARELALWTTLQREYRARGLLPGEALSRFEAIGLQWDTPDGSPAERHWMAWFGRLLYVIERHNTQLQPLRALGLGRPKMGRPRGSRTAAPGAGEAGEGGGSGGEGEGEEGEEDEEAPAAARRGSAAVAAARLRLQAEMMARRAALAAADLHSEPGLRFWLARQRRRWRRQELAGELALMLQLAGVRLDPYRPSDWQAMAHDTAALLHGSRIALGPAPQQPPPQQQQPGQHEVAGAAWGAAAAEAAAGAAAEAAAVAEGDAATPPGSARLRAARWVQTQQVLFAEGKLSPAQLRYMAFLGITWVLSEEVVLMSQPVWQQWCGRLAAAPRPLPPLSEPAEWLRQQRGLHALGWLPRRRRRALEALQVRLDEFDRCPEDDEWDARLSELLAFTAEHGHCKQLLAAAAGGGGGEQLRRWAPLAAWLGEQHRALAAGRLPVQRATQLAAIGAAPPPARARSPQRPKP